MKIGITAYILLLFVSYGFGQTEVQWNFTYDADQNQIVVDASIGDGWHLYSTQKAAELGPVPTEFEFKPTEGLELVGDIQEPKPKKAFDANFEETLYYFEESVRFTQEVKVEGAKEISGTVTYMVCNDTMCMPPVDVEFTIELDEN